MVLSCERGGERCEGMRGRCFALSGPHAVIDVGSNTVHLLVGKVEDGAVVPITGEKVSARLGSGVDETGEIEEERIFVAAEAIRLFSRLAALNGAGAPSILATSAVRDAKNGPTLVEEVRREAGLEVRLVSGEEEARLGFRGALSALSGFPRDRWALVVDLGGGSAQLILGDVEKGPERQVSLPLGSNRLTERHVAPHDPPRPKDLEAVRETVLDALPDWDLPEGTAVVAVGGSARAVVRIDGREPTVEGLKGLAAEICTRPSAVLAREEGLAPERARALPAAIMTLAAVLERYEMPSLAVTRGGIREGALLSMADEARAGAETREGK